MISFISLSAVSLLILLSELFLLLCELLHIGLGHGSVVAALVLFITAIVLDVVEYCIHLCIVLFIDEVGKTLLEGAAASAEELGYHSALCCAEVLRCCCGLYRLTCIYRSCCALCRHTGIYALSRHTLTEAALLGITAHALLRIAAHALLRIAAHTLLGIAAHTLLRITAHALLGIAAHTLLRIALLLGVALLIAHLLLRIALLSGITHLLTGEALLSGEALLCGLLTGLIVQELGISCIRMSRGRNGSFLCGSLGLIERIGLIKLETAHELGRSAYIGNALGGEKVRCELILFGGYCNCTLPVGRVCIYEELEHLLGGLYNTAVHAYYHHLGSMGLLDSHHLDYRILFCGNENCCVINDPYARKAREYLRRVSLYDTELRIVGHISGKILLRSLGIILGDVIKCTCFHICTAYLSFKL